MVKSQHSLLGIGLAFASLARASPIQNAPFMNTTSGAAAASHIVGSLILDDILSTCGSVNAARLEQAVNDYHLLALAAQGVHGDDESFQAYWGVGWVGKKATEQFPHIADNLFKAAQLAQPGQAPKARLTCADPTNHCKPRIGAFTDPVFGPDGVQTITFCPHAFNFKNIAYLAKQPAPQDIIELSSLEHQLLHETLHLVNNGYLTGPEFGGAKNKSMPATAPLYRSLLIHF